MRTNWFHATLSIVALLGLAACSQAEAPDTNLETMAVQQSSNVYAPFGCDFTAGACNVMGHPSLKRNAAGATLNVHTSGLMPGDAVTLWAVIFNNPDACSGTCGEDDLPPFSDNADPAVKASVLRVAGHVVGASGKGNFSGRVKLGDTSEAVFGPGLAYPDSAEIHAVVRTHGPAIPSLVTEQIHSVNGGCDVNVCEDLQFAIHLP